MDTVITLCGALVKGCGAAEELGEAGGAGR